MSKVKDAVVAFTVLGASGDLAKKLVYPALWAAWRAKLMPENTIFIGYARSKLSNSDLVERIKPGLKASGEEEEKQLDKFLERCVYKPGQYDQADAFQELNSFINETSTELRKSDSQKMHRVFYMALPPSVFEPVTENISKYCMGEDGWTRLIVEKPFGKDTESYLSLHKHLSSLFSEDQIYRIDHYLGKEMVQNLLGIRFGNQIFSPSWNKQSVAAVMITMKENFGTKGRGGYFDEFGIIRDVMQNHLLQILTLTAMECPVTLNPDDIRDEKVKVLKAIQPIRAEDIVLGQYTAGNVEGIEESTSGYTDDDGVPDDSKTPTFATAVLYIKNERWSGVPFIIRCGKALNEKKAELRVQFKDVSNHMYSQTTRNELVLRVQPDEAIYLKMMMKDPGLDFKLAQSDLDLTYKARYHDRAIPAAYERLILDVLNGDSTNFVRSDEVREAWRIFTPILHAIDEGEAEPIPYPFGSRGPEESDQLVKSTGYKYTAYEWKAKKSEN